MQIDIYYWKKKKKLKCEIKLLPLPLPSWGAAASVYQLGYIRSRRDLFQNQNMN